MSSLGGLYSSSLNQPLMAYYSSVGCAAAYAGGSDPAFSDYVNAIEAINYQYIPATASLPAVAIFQLSNPNVFLVCITGVQNLQQAIMTYVFSYLNSTSNFGSFPAVNAYAWGLWGLLKNSIGSAILQMLGSTGTAYIIMSGHSLGGLVAEIGYAYYKTVGTPYAAGSCYTFGKPKLGGAAYIAWQQANAPQQYHYRLDDDPIPNFPSDAIARNLMAVDAAGSYAGSYMLRTDYRSTPFHYQLYRNGTNGVVPSYDSLSVRQTADIIRSLVVDGELPNDHRINDYTLALTRAAEAQIRNQRGTPLREATVAVRSVTVEPQAQATTTSPSAFPSVYSLMAIPAPPTGGSVVAARQVAQVWGLPRIDFQPTQGQTNRASIGDGHAKQAARDAAEHIRHIIKHDNGVESKIHPGTQMLSNPAIYTSDFSDSLDTVLRTLEKIAEGV